MIRGTDLTKLFGPRTDDALALLERGASRSQVLEQTGCTVGVHDVSFEVRRGELFVVMGLSGSGKSTLVRMINRLIDPTAGSVAIDGRDLVAMDDAELRKVRNERISMVFQHFALFPHRTVRQNAAYGLHVRHESQAKQMERATWALEEVGLGDWADAYPAALSGGMKQRVGLARALATDAEVMLMDEPFSALDPLIRRDMQELLIRLQAELGKTIVFITHDLNEAMRLGDRILMLRDARVVQLGTGPEILSAPADSYVEDFVSDVDRTRVLTAGDTMSELRFVASLGDDPRAVLWRLEQAHANGVYVLDADGRIAGVARDDRLARAVSEGADAIGFEHLTDDYMTTTPDRALIDLVELVGRHVVPLGVVGEDGRLLGVVPRAGLLGAMVTRKRSAVHA